MEKQPIIMYKFGEPTMIKRKDRTYINDLDEWDKVIKKLKSKNGEK